MRFPKTPAEMRASPPSLHPIFTIIGVTALMLMLDVLHVVDHGVAQHVFAGIMWSLIFKQLPNRPEQNLSIIWKQIQGLYNEGRTQERLARFTMKMFVDPKAPHADFPKLSNAIKVSCLPRVWVG